MLIIAILFLLGVSVFVYGDYLDYVHGMECAEIDPFFFYNTHDKKFHFYMKG